MDATVPRMARFKPFERAVRYTPVSWCPTLRAPAYHLSSGRRFGHRGRPYLSHMAKALGSHFMQELETIWPDEFAKTASHIVRNDFDRDPDIYPGYLMTHYVVERWREALLWSFIVASMGDDDDGWDDWRAWKALGGRLGKNSVAVTRKPRGTLNKLRDSLVGIGATSNTPLLYCKCRYPGMKSSLTLLDSQPRWVSVLGPVDRKGQAGPRLLYTVSPGSRPSRNGVRYHLGAVLLSSRKRFP